MGVPQRVVLALHEAGDAEVEQGHLAGRRHEHIRGLEVAVHDEVGVCVRHRREHVEEQAQAGRHVELLPVAVAIDRHTFHVVEHQIRLADVGRAGIDEAGDARMLQPREDPAFPGEARFARAPDERDVQQLDRHTAFEPAVHTFGQPHAAHAALSDRRHQPVGTEIEAREPPNSRGAHGRLVEERIAVEGFARAEPFRDVAGQLGRARPQVVEPDLPLGRRQVQQRIEVRTGQTPALACVGDRWHQSVTPHPGER